MGRILLDLPLFQIQGLRLLHALTETGRAIEVLPEHIPRLSTLRRHFEVPCAAAVWPRRALPGVEIHHRQPRTVVGRVERPLIFPHAVLKHCRERWPPARPVAFSFAGLMTPSRRTALAGWTDCADVVLKPSDRGRTFPGKAWDDDYFQLLCRSRFALCPNGDHVWTYRFFEAAMCGAIPVVETRCALYEGFAVHELGDAEFDWSEAAAEHNFALCAERLTVPLATLAAEIDRLERLEPLAIGPIRAAASWGRWAWSSAGAGRPGRARRGP